MKSEIPVQTLGSLNKVRTSWYGQSSGTLNLQKKKEHAQ